MYRKEFVKTLELLADAFDRVVGGGHERPVIVGGAAVEFYTGGDIVSGDFDIVTGAQEALEEALQDLGFVRPAGVGQLLKGLVHPELGVGIEVVAGSLMDGRAEWAKVLLVEVAGHKAAFIGIEDMIADRMGQYNAAPSGVPEMREQAVQLLRVADKLDADLDLAYLDRRIRQKTAGDFGLSDLKEALDGTTDNHP